jgi:hypothetical protein
MSKLDPQIEALLEQFKANAARWPPPTRLPYGRRENC